LTDTFFVAHFRKKHVSSITEIILMNSNLIRYSVLFVLFVSLCSWGDKAHRKINSSCVGFFPKEIQRLKAWAPILADHASDADFRKKSDKNEFVKHFIDIDIYDDFIQTHRITEGFAASCAKYGKEKVIKNGTLPWVTDSTYKALVQYFKTGNWNKAVLTAADLGHYVGDGFMPLHITANYDGQLTAQTGIHRRYEEKMIDRYIGQVQIKVSGIHKVKQVQPFIFSYLYANYTYVGILLKADSQAFEQAGKQYSAGYYETLWKKTNLFTEKLLEQSSKTLAELIYTAWIEAGRPAIPESH
jgi:hypothetical protein